MKRTASFSFFACLGSVFLVMAFLDGPWAQAEEDRAARIRAQMGTQAPAQPVESALQELSQEISSNLASISARLTVIEKDMVDLKARLRVLENRNQTSGKYLDPAASAPENLRGNPVAREPGRRKPAAGKALVTYCASGCDASDLTEAVKQVAEGGVIALAPGDYTDCVIIKKSLKLVGKTGPDGARAHFKNTACGGTATFVISAPEVTIEGLKITGVSVPDQNGACFRVGPKAKTVRIHDILCSDSQEGLLGGTAKGGSLTIERSTFENNGFGGRAHDIYINSGTDVILRSVRILSAKNGHLLKSGASNLLVENSVLAALGGDTGRALDIYGGGKLTIRNSVIQLGPKTQNHDLIAYALESGRLVKDAPHELVIEKNWMIYDDPDRCCRYLFNKNSQILGAFSFRDNYIVGDITPVLSEVDMGLNKVFEDRGEAGLGEYDGTLASLPKPGSIPAAAN